MAANKYTMEHYCRGKALIVDNNAGFKQNTHLMLPDRPWSILDSQRLVDVLEDLKFDVDIMYDLSCSEIIKELQKLSSLDHEECDVVVVVLLSHGQISCDTDANNQLVYKGCIYGTDGMPFYLDQVTTYLDPQVCVSLAGKPKIIIAQGDHTAANEQNDAKGVRDDVPSSMEHLPDADFVHFFSAIPGSEKRPGSPMIQNLCDVLTDPTSTNHDNNFITQLQITEQRIIQEIGKNYPHLPNPQHNATLTKRLHLTSTQ